MYTKLFVNKYNLFSKKLETQNLLIITMNLKRTEEGIPDIYL
jgi:hypothetical protein